MADNDHSLTFDGSDRIISHPENDRDGCSFDDYVDRDWQQPLAGEGQYLFTFHEGGPDQPEGYWNGTYIS